VWAVKFARSESLCGSLGVVGFVSRLSSWNVRATIGSSPVGPTHSRVYFEKFARGSDLSRTEFCAKSAKKSRVLECGRVLWLFTV